MNIKSYSLLLISAFSFTFLIPSHASADSQYIYCDIDGARRICKEEGANAAKCLTGVNIWEHDICKKYKYIENETAINTIFKECVNECTKQQPDNKICRSGCRYSKWRFERRHPNIKNWKLIEKMPDKSIIYYDADSLSLLPPERRFRYTIKRFFMEKDDIAFYIRTEEIDCKRNKWLIKNQKNYDRNGKSHIVGEHLPSSWQMIGLKDVSAQTIKKMKCQGID